jgi:hypothetical protein
MPQNDSSIGWDPIYVTRSPGTLVEILTLISLIALVILLMRLIRLWITAPPFRLSRQAYSPNYLESLQTLCTSTKHWIGFMLMAWGFVTCTQLTQSCNRLLESKAMGGAALVFAIRDVSISFSLGLFAAFLLFLAQWHLHLRIQYLCKLSAQQANP